jgi:hypothetical protein
MTPEQGTRQVRPGATGGVHGLAQPAVPPLTRDGPAAESALVAEHLGKRFGDRVAFDDVSFEVGYGEVFGFSGRTEPGRRRPCELSACLSRRRRARRGSPVFP